MKMTEFLLAQLADEAPRTRRALERVPEGRGDWAPHDRSMPFGRLAGLVARMPSWIPMIVNQDSLDLNPPGGSTYNPAPLGTSADLVKAHDEGVSEARRALERTSEDHLKRPWKLMVAGKVVSEQPRETVLRDTFMHLAHHRGQLTVYLRLAGAPVPAIYGPSADDVSFA
jgi:DinB family protein